ncbi:hypothetical protein J695_3829 [Acinetobacter baumannii 1406182]|nr:hypothetical protein J695_3829 [Acinetobacter baumannii 1406182]
MSNLKNAAMNGYFSVFNPKDLYCPPNFPYTHNEEFEII